MDYINAKEAADKWGLSVRRVQVLCEQGRVDGVEQLGNVWLIPKNAEKPLDGRTREAKKQKTASEIKMFRREQDDKSGTSN